MIVVDAGVLATALADDGDSGKRIRQRLTGEDLAAPALIDLEVTSVLRKGILAGALTDHRAALAMSDLIDLPMERVPHVGLLRRVWELHNNVTPYDAAYVALAELLSAPLLTADVRLSKAPGPQCDIEVISDL
jgi:predicted nucleic acid-binding protein